MTQPCTLYIVRHGETEYNVTKKIQGGVDSPLTAIGRQQAKDRARELEAIEFAAVYSSDLGRAVTTAEILKLDRELKVLTSELLRERSFGTFEGKPIAYWREKLQEKLDQRDKLSAENLFTYEMGNSIETDQQIFTRYITILREIAVAYPGKTVLVVSHGSVMRTVLIHLGFGTPQELGSHSVENLGYMVLESDGTDFEIIQTEGIGKLED